MSPTERRILIDERVKQLVTECPECGAELSSTGQLVHDAAIDQWMAQFWCETDQLRFPSFKPEYTALIEQVVTEARSGDADL